MNILVDENIPHISVSELPSMGHDVLDSKYRCGHNTFVKFGALLVFDQFEDEAQPGGRVSSLPVQPRAARVPNRSGQSRYNY